MLKEKKTKLKSCIIWFQGYKYHVVFMWRQTCLSMEQNGIQKWNTHIWSTGLQKRSQDNVMEEITVYSINCTTTMWYTYGKINKPLHLLHTICKKLTHHWSNYKI